MVSLRTTGFLDTSLVAAFSLWADRGLWGQGCGGTTLFRRSDSFVKPKSVCLPHTWNSRAVRQLERGSHGAPCLRALALSGSHSLKTRLSQGAAERESLGWISIEGLGAAPGLSSPLHEVLS